MLRLHTLLTSFFCLAMASTAFGQAVPERVGVGVFGGGFEGDATYDSGPSYDLRATYSPLTFLTLELSIGMIDSSMYAREQVQVSAPRDARLITSSLSSLLFLSEGRVHPYLIFGVGSITDKETYLAGNLGLGAGYALNRTWSLRAEGKAWLSDDAPATDRFQHLQIAFGVTYEWGGSEDIDGDGIVNFTDQCRSDAEDKDGFEDENGCPDFDNDGDGVDDEDDKCPLKAEDKDDDRDDDGCPDEDQDEDGVDDLIDQCVDEAEDKDGFEDEDGCPDADNDSDGIDDAKDKCPLKAEDQDSFEDEDGCPEPDNDQDGVLDADDACPTTAGTANGCPQADVESKAPPSGDVNSDEAKPDEVKSDDVKSSKAKSDASTADEASAPIEDASKVPQGAPDDSAQPSGESDDAQ